MIISDHDLLTLLQEGKYVSEKELKRAQDYASVHEISLEEALVSVDAIADDNLGKLVADRLSLPFVSLSHTPISREVLFILPEEAAEKTEQIVFAQTPDEVSVASSNPDPNVASYIGKKTGKKVKLFYATQRDIRFSLSLYKKEFHQTFTELLNTHIDTSKNSVNDIPVAKLLNSLIEYAYYSKASDVHVEPGEEGGIVRFRIDGILHDIVKLPNKSLHEQLISRVKVAASLRTDEHASAQDGKMRVTLPEEELDIRVSIVPITAGEKAVFRLLSSRFRQFGLSDLGMSDDNLMKIKKAVEKPQGMILSTGPTGSGKTTTVYSLIKILNSREKNIATIEDPVEYQIEGINQIQVNQKTNLTFADGLRSILRQDPDIIYIGEIRDEETAGIAVNSAMTGHLVLSTLHTNDAATAVVRLLDMKSEPYLVASTISVIVGQRLVRTVCSKCRVSYSVTPEELGKKIPKDYVSKYFSSDGTITLVHGKGCAVCQNTGYTGRLGIFEILVASDAIKELITNKADSDVINKQAIEEGMTTMMEDGLMKVTQGLTTIEEVLRVTTE